MDKKIGLFAEKFKIRLTYPNFPNCLAVCHTLKEIFKTIFRKTFKTFAVLHSCENQEKLVFCSGDYEII